MQFWEMVVTFVLIAPLVVTTIVLSINLLLSGVSEITGYLNRLKEEKTVEEPKLPTDPYPESDVVRYIHELRREREKDKV